VGADVTSYRIIQSVNIVENKNMLPTIRLPVESNQKKKKEEETKKIF